MHAKTPLAQAHIYLTVTYLQTQYSSGNKILLILKNEQYRYTNIDILADTNYNKYFHAKDTNFKS